MPITVRKINKSIASHVIEYIGAHPAVKECLRRGLINHSELAREIRSSLKIKNQAATTAAVRRYAIRISSQPSVEKQIDLMFRSSQVLVRSNLVVSVLRRPVDFAKLNALVELAKKERESVNVIEGEHVVTIISSQRLVSIVKERFRKDLDEIVPDLAQVSIALTRKSMRTAGVSARLSSMMAQAGINLYQEITCSGEYLILIASKDLPAALELLK
jgi:hypothetical protein